MVKIKDSKGLVSTMRRVKDDDEGAKAAKKLLKMLYGKSFKVKDAEEGSKEEMIDKIKSINSYVDVREDEYGITVIIDNDSEPISAADVEKEIEDIIAQYGYEVDDSDMIHDTRHLYLSKKSVKDSIDGSVADFIDNFFYRPKKVGQIIDLSDFVGLFDEEGVIDYVEESSHMKYTLDPQGDNKYMIRLNVPQVKDDCPFKEIKEFAEGLGSTEVRESKEVEGAQVIDISLDDEKHQDYFEQIIKKLDDLGLDWEDETDDNSILIWVWSPEKVTDSIAAKFPNKVGSVKDFEKAKDYISDSWLGDSEELKFKLSDSQIKTLNEHVKKVFDSEGIEGSAEVYRKDGKIYIKAKIS